MITTRIDGITVNLPDPESIPVPETRKALEHALVIVAARQKAQRDRDSADDAVRDAGNVDRARLGEQYFADPDHHDANPSAAVEAARKELDDAQGRLNGLLDAERLSLIALREAMNAEGDAWAKIARTDAAKAVTKLNTAAKMAGQARAELESTIGVLGLLRSRELVRAEGGEGLLSVMPKANGYAFELNPAVEGLHTALVSATNELSDLS